MAQVTVVCPHCSSTGTFNHGLGSATGSFSAQCKHCHKSFRVYLRQGQLYEVKLH